MENINLHYNDCFFSNEGGLEESVWVFVKGNRIDRFPPYSDIYVGETGFGSGLNLLALASYLSGEQEEYSGTLDYFSCEKYPLLPEQVYQLLSPFFNKDKHIFGSYIAFYTNIYKKLEKGDNFYEFKLGSVNIKLNLYYGDVVDALTSITEKRDVWFLDGHDPEKNPDMWDEKVFRLIYSKSHSGTTLSTYTAKGSVKQGLRKAGFYIKRKKGYGRKRHMITGIYEPFPENHF